MLKTCLFMLASLAAVPAQAADTLLAANEPLSQQLADLGGGSGSSPSEPLYIVQDRAAPLGGVFEIAGGVGKNFNPNIYVNSSDTDLFLAYHWNNRFYTALSGAYVVNQLTPSGQSIWDNDGIYPNTAFVKRRADLTLGVNLIYGKARITKDAVFYFDQYVALGAGVVEETNGVDTSRVPAGVADLGLAFWFGHRVSFRLGAKEYRFVERRLEGSSMVNHILGYSTIGLLLGGAG